MGKKRIPPEERFWPKVDKSDDCWVWTAARYDFGHGRFTLRHGKSVRAHRFAWELANGPIPDDVFVCHHCDNPPCVNPAHLFLGTQADNLHDMRDKGRAVWGRAQQRGERNGLAKLTAEKVVEIRSLYAQGGRRQEDIGREFGISGQCVSDIVTRKTWAHV